jgi:hypothetical protein
MSRSERVVLLLIFLSFVLVGLMLSCGIENGYALAIDDPTVKLVTIPEG